MRRVPRPKLTATEALDLCISSVRDADLKRRLGLVRRKIANTEAEYLREGPRGRLYLLPESLVIGRSVTGEEMDTLYNSTFVKSAKTRAEYGKLKKSCANDICPLCGQRTVHQLDHYLPVSRHALLAVTAANLVPSCSDCNKSKLAHTARKASEQTLHPYFDDLEADRWLFAEVVQASASLAFAVRPPATVSRINQARLQTHFKTFALGSLYSSHAGAEVADIKHHLARLSTRRGASARVRAYLEEQAASRANAHVNSWQTATYEALASSAWFCGGGFNSF